MIPRLRPALVGLLAPLAAVTVWLHSSIATHAVVEAATIRPRLVVVLMVDQFRGDYVTRFGQQWSGGLRRLFDQGSWFPLAAYPYSTTVTCAGHATVATGSFPSTHGIIGNSWFDRERGRIMRCTEDPASPSIDYGDHRPARRAADAEPRGESAWRLRVPTLSDELRAQLTPLPRIVTMSLKQRSAIMLAGHRGDSVTWLDSGPTWTTSEAYAEGPVPFMARFLDAHPIERALGDVWDRMLPTDAYLFDDDVREERPPGGWAPAFPHPLTGRADGPDRQFYVRWQYSPFTDDYLGRMAGAAVEALDLGQRDTTDYLGVSFSALDFVGHQFGPRSHEVQDTLIRLDRTIGTLLDELDRTVGTGHYVVALSGDHGVAPIPEWMARQGFDAGRIDTAHVGPLLDAMLSRLLGSRRYVARVAGTDVYFEPGVPELLADEPLARSLVEDVLRTVPGVGRVLWADQVQGAVRARDPERRAAALGFDRERSPDLIGLAKPYWIQGAAASHGSANLYDRRVPVVLYGAGIRPGRHLTPASPADIAPTLAQLTGVTLARPDGRVLEEAIRESGVVGREQ